MTPLSPFPPQGPDRQKTLGEILCDCSVPNGAGLAIAFVTAIIAMFIGFAIGDYTTHRLTGMGFQFIERSVDGVRSFSVRCPHGVEVEEKVRPSR